MRETPVRAATSRTRRVAKLLDRCTQAIDIEVAYGMRGLSGLNEARDRLRQNVAVQWRMRRVAEPRNAQSTGVDGKQAGCRNACHPPRPARRIDRRIMAPHPIGDDNDSRHDDA